MEELIQALKILHPKAATVAVSHKDNYINVEIDGITWEYNSEYKLYDFDDYFKDRTPDEIQRLKTQDNAQLSCHVYRLLLCGKLYIAVYS